MSQFSIEGNIGSGKTTLLKNIIKCLNLSKKNRYMPKYEIQHEPLSTWENIKDNDNKNMLELVYEDPKKYGFAFQVLAMTTFFNKQNTQNTQNTQEQNLKNTILMERSIESTYHVFTKMAIEEKYIEEPNIQILDKLYQSFNPSQSSQSSQSSHQSHKYMIYIRSHPIDCLKRIQHRNRKGESNITLKYLEDVDMYHEFMIDNIKTDNLLILDDSMHIEEKTAMILRFMQTKANKINKINKK